MVITLNNKEEGQRRLYPPDTMFEFNRTDDNVSVEADSKEEFHMEEKKNIEQLSCDIYIYEPFLKILHI